MTSAAKELPPNRLATVNRRHAGGERFRVHVLGRFRLLDGDTPITIPPRLRKPQELLQALTAFGGAEVSAGVLIDALWPGALVTRPSPSITRASQPSGAPGVDSLFAPPRLPDEEEFA